MQSLYEVRVRDLYAAGVPELIKSLKSDYTIAFLCFVFEVSRTSYYNFEKGKTYNLEAKYKRPRHEIRLEFHRNMKRYGAIRMQALLKIKGIILGRRTVSKIMKEEGLIKGDTTS